MSLQILFGKLIALLIKHVLHRNASTWPGHLALEANTNFIKQVLKQNKKLKIILIAGTNGKTTTTKALHHILESNNISVIRNDSGANLLNGLASLLIKESSLTGNIRKDALLFEVDENSLPLICSQFSIINFQFSIILLNLFRDQLDRYGEINTTSEKWSEALKKAPAGTTIVANADDPQIVKIAKAGNSKRYFYSINNNLKTEIKLSHAVDSTTCPSCRNNLEYSKIAYSHLGNFKCPKCGFTNPKAEVYDIKTNLKGEFNIYNLTASILTADKIFGLSPAKSIQSLNDFKPAFGRQEEIIYKNKKVNVLLSKNPAGLNESLKIVLENKYKNLLILLNDRIPDGRDISWIWDVDFEMLSDKNLNITVSGDRTYDLASRLKYSNVKTLQLENNLSTALEKALKISTENQTLVILPTYSAMLEVRKLLTGKSIL